MSEEKKQKFVIRHYAESEFKTGGLRPAAEYRDLGAAEATNGMYTAHVARLLPGALVGKKPSLMHHHDLNFHMIYVLKGWMKAEFEGEGVHTMRAGCCWFQPPGINHKVLAQSEDMELIEIMSPADFDTINVE